MRTTKIRSSKITPPILKNLPTLLFFFGGPATVVEFIFCSTESVIKLLYHLLYDMSIHKFDFLGYNYTYDRNIILLNSCIFGEFVI